MSGGDIQPIGEGQARCSGCAGQNGCGAASTARLGAALAPYPTTGAAADRHGVRRASMAWRIVSSWRMHVVSATSLAFPAAHRRSWSALMAGLKGAGASAARYSTARMPPRPPHTLCLPRNVPLSRFKGAPPDAAHLPMNISRPMLPTTKPPS